MPTVHGTTVSGNCWKARQILELTGQPGTWVEVDANANAAQRVARTRALCRGSGR